MEYIGREAAIALYEDDAVDMSVLKVPVPVIIQNLKDVQAADVLPVVRCRDCKHNQGVRTWIDHDITADCMNGHGYPLLDWFCADGVKREEN